MSRMILWFLLLLICHAADGQFIPSGISYQAVARESGGAELINQNLTVRIGMLRDSPSGTLVYEEVHDAVTNGFGLFSLTIGEGVSTGNASLDELATVPFGAAPHFIRIDIDTPQSPGFEFLGTTELLAVPYAYHAATADSAPEQDGDPTNELISTVTLIGNTLSITEAGVSHQVNLSGLIGQGGSNALISSVDLTGMSLQIVQNGVPHTVDLSSLSGGTWQVSDGAVHTNQLVGIGQNQPTSNLHINGSFATAVQHIAPALGSNAPPIALTAQDHVVIADVSNGVADLLLPQSTTCVGRIYQLRKVVSNPSGNFPLTLNATSGDTIDGVIQKAFIAQSQEFISVIATQAGWFILNHSIAD